MGESPLVIALSAVGAIITAIGGYFGVRINARNAKQAHAITVEIERSKIDAEAYDSAREIWDALINDLRNQVADQRKELAELRRVIARSNAEVNKLRDRLEDLEAKRAVDHQMIQTVINYARQLRQLLKSNGISAPPAPAWLGVEDTQPNGHG